MNSYINTVTTNPSSLTIPSVTYNQNTNEIFYNGEMRWTSNKAEAKPGDIVLHYYKRDDVWFASPSYFNSHAYLQDDDWNEMNVIGVVVVPSSHTSDGTVRIVSVNFMDNANPEEGSATYKNIMWGNQSTNLSLTDYHEIVTVVPGTSTTSTRNYSYIPTNYHRYKYLRNTQDLSTHWSQGAILDDIYSPSPYNNGVKSTVYHTTGKASADMNGKSNTDTIMAAVTASWSGSTINNSSAVGNYPAACCCRRYYAGDSEDIYFGTGYWYLPSIGELGYLCARFEEIDRSRRMCGGGSMHGSSYWSSTEFGSNYAWHLNMSKSIYFGYVDNGNKISSTSVVAFCSF